MAHEQRIIVTEPLSREATDWLSDRASVQQIGVEDPGFKDALERASGIIVRTYTTVDRDMLDRAPDLRVVGRAGTGLDNIDVDACRERGIEVVHTPDANRQAVVEYVTSILTTVLRPLPPPIDRGHTPAEWAAARRSATAQRQMSECRLGILGLGAIGKRVAEVATAIGMCVQYHDIEEIPPEHRCGGVPVALDVLLHSSDVLTIHVDGRADNRHFLSTDQFNQLLPNVLLINTSRGFVIDSRALAAMLRTHPDSMAVLDVHEHEPIVADDPLLSVPNATLLPHAASRTAAAQLAMSWVVQDVWKAVERSL
jgi:phosphoglycerate dehydrogenase-like enzyme